MPPIANTQSGKVQGRVADGLEIFLGIPFAAPPVGALRFRPPVPPEPWSGALEATAFGPDALQPQ